MRGDSAGEWPNGRCTWRRGPATPGPSVRLGRGDLVQRGRNPHFNVPSAAQEGPARALARHGVRRRRRSESLRLAGSGPCWGGRKTGRHGERRMYLAARRCAAWAHIGGGLGRRRAAAAARGGGIGIGAAGLHALPQAAHWHPRGAGCPRASSLLQCARAAERGGPVRAGF